MATLSQTIQERRAERPALARSVLSGLGGLAIGVGASSVFALLFTGLPDAVLVPTIIVTTVGAGACFAQLVAYARNETAGWRRITAIGLVLPLVSLVGLLMAGLFEPFGLGHPEPMPVLVFRLGFVPASAAIAFVCSLIAGWTFRVRGPWACALLVALVTAGVYLLVALVVDPLPGMHVGGGAKAMPRVAALANFGAGLVGGAFAHHLLSRARAVERA
jgi:hypothetical protein